MSTASAIGMVSETLRNLLLGKMDLPQDGDVTVLAPDESSNKKCRINLFLYKVQENPALKNMDWQVKPGSPSQLVPPPLSLNLFYLVTAYNQNDQETGNSPAHKILGEAMRVFYEYPIVPQDYFPEGFEESREQIKIMLNTLDLEELSKIWATFSIPFRLSALYEVSVVQLDMLSEREREMARRVEKIGYPEVRAPYDPPVLKSIEPINGPAGSDITIHGKNLAGWKAYVTIMGRKVMDAADLFADSFQLTLPADLLPGFYEIRVDISHLCRRTFFFEVTTVTT
ncbi:MAG: DUF4255 domain-containing protein [Candidatus Aminicenantes bacterium]|nr:DUF4255 domain-containing protein [Candidatus Aminicenantes bacterium]NIM85002.1 DUF4255 domain-containing protein [Candidatus Aminicenantes bacterium]NIN24516.1 DUF4255 domain-containing protein [Candidatus Aminicenantes bacterium]NIN48280.1 DUF4255 domain-containing protein [Candidatus Aminicenantes bacterium]NIN91183.1 DUF4255 domain-containing protein [Candidatus Aminicenantes bacterium]